MQKKDVFKFCISLKYYFSWSSTVSPCSNAPDWNNLITSSACYQVLHRPVNDIQYLNLYVGAKKCLLNTGPWAVQTGFGDLWLIELNLRCYLCLTFFHLQTSWPSGEGSGESGFPLRGLMIVEVGKLKPLCRLLMGR